MKKYILLFTLISAFAVFPKLIYSQGVQQRINISPSPTGNEIQNQIQNQGEEQQIQTQEQESLENATGEGSQNRNQNAIQNMSEVAKQVQQLLQVRTTGGIGEQVRQIAQEQNQAQTQIQEQVNKLDSKGKFSRFLTVTNFVAIKNLKVQLEQNQLRIKKLEQLQNQLSNGGEITTVQETIQALIAENTLLQERIVTEEQTKSLFGWLVKL